MGKQLSTNGRWIKGCIPWNKGKKLSKEHIKNLSLSHIGNIPWNKGKKSPKLSGKKHFFWKGDSVGYYALHVWLFRNFGRPYKCEMIGCKYPRLNKRKEIMLLPKRYEWASKAGIYSRCRKDWIMLCPSCHRQYDAKYNIKYNNKKI